MMWYVNIGDNLVRDQTIRFSFHRDLDDIHDEFELLFRDSLFECEEKSVHLFTQPGRNIFNFLITNQNRAAASLEECQVQH
jgi:hypothetical protein